MHDGSDNQREWTADEAGRLGVADLDAAVEAAGRKTGASVAQFAAAAGDRPGGPLEVAVEFWVPPGSVGEFSAELDLQLSVRVPAYASARRRGDLPAALVRAVPGGTFHQWRVAWRHSEEWQHDRRWSVSRDLLDAILRQARTGWREILPVCWG